MHLKLVLDFLMSIFLTKLTSITTWLMFADKNLNYVIKMYLELDEN